MSASTSNSSGHAHAGVARILPPIDDDLTESQLVAWSQKLDAFFQYGIDRAKYDDGYTNAGLRPEFYSPAQRVPVSPVALNQVHWIAFPGKVKAKYAGQGDELRWQAADDPTPLPYGGRTDKGRGCQDEYCEWSVTRNSSGQIVSVQFTCEGPEYFQFLAEVDKNKALALYRQHISPDVQAADIFDSTGAYITNNKWNDNTVTGAMHLIQGANTLEAEIILAADGTVRRPASSSATAQQLINCSLYGVPTRNSDPNIGFSCNQLILSQNCYLSLANPVGLFFHSFQPNDSWQTPDGTDPKDFWQFTRGTPAKGDNPARWVRAVYSVPASKNYTVSDITINGDNINYGAQIADFIEIHLTAATDSNGHFKAPQPIYNCRQPENTDTLSNASVMSANNEHEHHKHHQKHGQVHRPNRHH